MTSAEARALLMVHDPLPVAMRNSKGEAFNEDGERIDPRQLEPWVWAYGPFGSWPETLETAEANFAADRGWTAAPTLFRRSAIWFDRGWGYEAVPSSRIPHGGGE